MVVAALAVTGWLAGTASAATLARALDHLAAVQDPRGGGFAEGRGTDPTITSWGALAIAAAPGAWKGDEAPLRRAVVRTLGPTLADAEHGAVTLAAWGADPRAVAGRDLVREILAAQRPDGSIGADTSTTAWGILALRAARLAPDAGAVIRARDALERTQRPDGGWVLGAGSPGSGPNTTADAVQALVAAGRTPRAPSLVRARRFLVAAQNPDGGFPAVVGGTSTALTTAWVALAVRALGERGGRAPWNRAGGPRAFLTRLQRPDGAVRNTAAASTGSVWATSQTALALAGRRLPIPGPPARPTGRDR